VNPAQLDYFAASYLCSDATDPSFDYNCNSVEEQAATALSTGCLFGCTACSCTPGWCPTGWPDASGLCRGVAACGITSGWVTGCVPASATTDGGTTDAYDYPEGGTDIYTDAPRDGTVNCVPVLEARAQRCR
jgi:hypothetical protein